MSKVVLKLFGNSEQAAKALSLLKAKGYTQEEVGVLISAKANATAFTRDASKISKLVKLGDMGTGIATGPLAEAGTAKDVSSTLAKLWGIAQESVGYYEAGVAHGSVAISVHAPEAKLEEAKKLLREASAGPRDTTKSGETSPAFSITTKMAATNPVDAKMTGDFRKY